MSATHTPRKFPAVNESFTTVKAPRVTAPYILNIFTNMIDSS